MERVLSSFTSARDAENESRVFINDLLKSVFESIDTALVESLDIDLTVDICLAKLHKLANLANYKHDGVVNLEPDENSEPMEYHRADEEPAPVPIDPWARGVIQIKKSTTHESSHFKLNTGIVSPSASSYKSSVYGKSSRRSSFSNAMSSKRGGGGNTSSIISPSIIELDDDAHAHENINETGHMFDMLAKARKLLKQEGKGKDMMLTDVTMGGDKSKSTSRLNGVIVDVDGRPISLEPVKVELLPPYAIPLSYSISTYVADQAETKVSTIKKKKIPKVAGARAIDDSSHFTATVSLVTQLADNLKFPLNPGVSLKANGNLREGPPLENNPKKASRTQYFNKTAEITKRPPSNMNMSQVNGSTPSRGGDNKKGGNDIIEDFEVSDAILAMTSRFADMDALEGGRMIEPAVVIPLEAPDYDVKYFSSSLNNSTSPKMSLEPRRAQVTFALERPRDRGPPQAQLKPSERKRLPAPGIGKSINYGQSDKSATTMNDAGKDKVTTKREDILRAIF